jgi:hypothetical protein
MRSVNVVNQTMLGNQLLNASKWTNRLQSPHCKNGSLGRNSDAVGLGRELCITPDHADKGNSRRNSTVLALKQKSHSGLFHMGHTRYDPHWKDGAALKFDSTSERPEHGSHFGPRSLRQTTWSERVAPPSHHNALGQMYRLNRPLLWSYLRKRPHIFWLNPQLVLRYNDHDIVLEDSGASCVDIVYGRSISPERVKPWMEEAASIRITHHGPPHGEAEYYDGPPPETLVEPSGTATFAEILRGIPGIQRVVSAPERRSCIACGPTMPPLPNQMVLNRVPPGSEGPWNLGLEWRSAHEFWCDDYIADGSEEDRPCIPGLEYALPVPANEDDADDGRLASATGVHVPLTTLVPCSVVQAAAAREASWGDARDYSLIDAPSNTLPATPSPAYVPLRHFYSKATQTELPLDSESTSDSDDETPLEQPPTPSSTSGLPQVQQSDTESLVRKIGIFTCSLLVSLLLAMLQGVCRLVRRLNDRRHRAG